MIFYQLFIKLILEYANTQAINPFLIRICLSYKIEHIKLVNESLIVSIISLTNKVTSVKVFNYLYQNFYLFNNLM